MTLHELADILQVNIQLFRFPDQDERWIASFLNCEIKARAESPLLFGTSGAGKTPSLAMNDYCQKLRGKILVFNATTESRREFMCPQSLEDYRE